MRNLALNDDRICAAVIVHFPAGDAVFELRTLQSETPSQVLAVYGERSATVRYEAAFDRGRSQWLRRVSTAKRKRPDDVGRGLKIAAGTRFWSAAPIPKPMAGQRLN